MDQTFDWIKQQLWDYYKKMNDYAINLAQEIVVIDLFTGERSKELVIPAGLRDELGFIRDEIALWQMMEKNSL